MTDQKADPDEDSPLGNNDQDPEGGDPNNESGPADTRKVDSDRQRTGGPQAADNRENDLPA